MSLQYKGMSGASYWAPPASAGGYGGVSKELVRYLLGRYKSKPQWLHKLLQMEVISLEPSVYYIWVPLTSSQKMYLRHIRLLFPHFR